MREYTIVLGGMSSVEKGDLLKQVVHSAHGELTTEQSPLESMLHGVITTSTYKLRLRAINGATLYPEVSMTKLLQGAHLVVYILSDIDIARTSDPRANILQQRRELEQYIQCAHATKTHWRYIPWLWIASKNKGAVSGQPSLPAARIIKHVVIHKRMHIHAHHMIRESDISTGKEAALFLPIIDSALAPAMKDKA
jgi:hypothetical protein